MLNPLRLFDVQVQHGCPAASVQEPVQLLSRNLAVIDSWLLLKRLTLEKLLISPV